MENGHLLKKTRIGILISNRQDGSAIGVPVWFDWNGDMVRCFAGADSPKVRRLSKDPRASLLITNEVGESEAWLAFDGKVEIQSKGGIELAQALAPEYLDLADPALAKKLDEWRTYPDAFVLLELKPEKIRSGH